MGIIPEPLLSGIPEGGKRGKEKLMGVKIKISKLKN
jgi:hypothetical protein